MPNQRPQQGEYAPYYEPYLKLVDNDDLMEALTESHAFTLTSLALVPNEKSEYRYAQGKWSVVEVLQHIADTERVMAYRALRISRNDQTPLPGFDQDDYIREFDCSKLSVEMLALDLAAVRQSTIALFRHMDDNVLMRKGTANNFQVSVRALGYIIVGHERHHLKILQEKYKV